MQAYASSDGQSDLAALWQDAVQKYAQKSKKGRKLIQFEVSRVRNMSDIMTQVDTRQDDFDHFRDRDSKAGKVRSAFSRQLGNMKKCVGCLQAIGSAAAVFPPAMPVSLVFAACNQLLDSFAAVSADYDKVEEFYAFSGRFFDQMTILESEVASGPLARCIVQVFSSMLEACGVAQAMTEDRKGVKSWLHKVWSPEDSEISTCFTAMQGYIEELGRTVNYSSYKEIRETHRETMRTNTKLDQMDDQMFNLSKLMNDQKDMSLVISNQIRAQNEAQSAQFKSLFARLDKQHLRMMAPSNEKKKHEAKSAGKGDLRDKRLTAILRIKKYLNDYFEETHWRDADDESKAIQRDIQDTFVDGTGNWLINGDKVFTAWIDGECPVLWLQGLEGIGKTFLSFAATKKVQELSGHKSVALFGFRENQPSIQKVEVAFACMALQIAQKNNKYAEKLATHLDRMGKPTEDTSLWKHLFTSMFPATSSTDETEDSEEHLYLVFDGIDEADELERKCLFEFLEEISAKKSHVHALLTSRAEMWQHVANTNHSIVNVTRENIANDARTLIARRMKTLPRLRKFSSVVQKRIVKRVHAHTDSMLYIEHCLRRLSSIGREKAVLNELDSLPDSLHALYKLLLDDCKKNRSQQQYEALKKLFAWLAYSKRSLTLLEATALTDMLVAQGDRFDIEDEILGRSSRILELSGDRAVDDDVDAEAQTEAIDNFDDQVEDSEIDGESLAYYSKSVTFQERALRHYFTIVSAEDDEDMRIPPLHAHLDILESSTRIIEQLAESTPSKNVQELGDYAVNHWYQHLMGIDVNKASNEQVWKVVLAIHRVMSASLEKAKAIGQRLSVESFYQRDVDIYFHNWFDDMLQWVKRSHSLLEIAPNSEIRKWVAEVGEDEKAAMNALVRGHSQAWLLSLDESNIVQMFNCAKGALKMQGVDIPEDGTLHSVMLVADHFDDLQDDARAWRVRAATMNELAWEDDIEATEQDWDKIQEFYEKSIALETGNSDINRFQAYFHLAQNAICDDDWEITLQNLDKAHATLLPEHRQEMKKKLIDLALIKTNCLSSMGRAEDALAASNEARLVAGEDLLSGYDLDDLTMAFNEENDKTGHHLMTFLKSWTEKELHNWYDFVFGEDIDEAQFLLFRAAWRSDQIDFVPTTISNYQKKLRPWSTTLFATYIVLAWFYQWVVRDRVKAKELNKVALGLKIKPVDDMDWCQEQISGLLMNRALLIFAEFNESTDPLRKTQLVEELKSIPDNAVGGNNTFDESHVDMVLANMLSIMGPAVTYKEHMDKIFNSCVEGLEDTVSWNDASSLRLFAKVLSAFPSLERDALIALSSQFSILDKEVVDETSEGSDSDSESESESESESPADNAEADSEDAQEKLPELDEDLTNTPIYCNNEDCQFRIKRWSQPFYLCLLCTSCDLCAPCYEKRLVWNRTGTVDSWCSYCDKDHVYMKGPMKDWKGIKDGIIHIGEEKIAFKDWLKEIKEVKWKKAWDEFWIKGYGRRSIGC